jgi:hypothetical protein
MNAVSVPQALPPRESLVLPVLLMLLFGIILGWAAHSILSLQPVPVPLVPCKTCAEKCPCPRLAGAVRCGCAQ